MARLLKRLFGLVTILLSLLLGLFALLGYLGGDSDEGQIIVYVFGGMAAVLLVLIWQDKLSPDLKFDEITGL